MKFSGRLQIEADPRNWLKTDLNLSHGRLELVSGGDILGSWSTAQVKAERVEGDRFQLHLGEDRAVFAADDALAFSYEALPALAKKTVLASATSLRGKLRKGLAGAERPPQPDAHDLFESTPIPSPDVQHGDDQADLSEVPQPTRKLRDLIQAAVRSNVGETPSPEANNWRGPEFPNREGNSEEPAVVEEDSPEPETFDQVWSEPEEKVPDLEPEPDVVAEPSVEHPSLPNLTEIGHDEVQQERSNFDLSPIFAEPAAAYETIERARPSHGLLDLEGTGFENGDTLGERPAEPFGWIRAAEEAMPIVVEPSTKVVRSLDTLIEEVRNGGMTPAQVGALTDLIRAVAEAVEDKKPRLIFSR
ncbi:MAG TPA: hypothetical protein VM848_11255 [Acidimicrobiia bacterium]|nr:hypothetical protein [Acidimicrobiia bacterium]